MWCVHVLECRILYVACVCVCVCVFMCVQAAAQCYIDLIVKESDNNVKLIVLDRLTALKDVRGHNRVMQVKGMGCG